MVGAAILMMVVLGTLGGFFLAWPLAIVYWLNTGRLLDWTPRRHVPWTFIDLVVIVLLALLVLLGIAALMQELRIGPLNGQVINLREQHVSAMADTAWKFSVMVLATLYLVVKARITWRDFGLSWRDLGTHVLIGVITFVMLAPPVYAIQAAIVYLGDWKYEHPLIEMLQKSPDIWLFALLAFSACIMAPLSEEWFFRVLLQGWLERASAWLARAIYTSRVEAYLPAGELRGAALDTAVLGAESTDTSLVAASLAAPPAAVDDHNPHAAWAVAPAVPLPNEDEAREEPFPRSVLAHWLPILISSVLFGLAHWGHGPAPIPLTLLAIGLGYVYQRTHSIAPVIVVHALFNSVSMLIFYVYMFEFKQPLP